MLTLIVDHRGDSVGVLDDISVVELSIAIAGPSCARTLAFHGATVMKVESRDHPDVARLFGSAWAAGAGPEVVMDTTPYLGEMGANKRSVGLDLKQPEGRRAALALLAAADVFITNYTTPAVRDLGLAYEEVVAVNPRIVYLALPGFGSGPDLPYYEFLAWGPNQAPLVGLDGLTGYPDQQPAGIATVAPPDYFAGLHAVAAVLTALEHRDRTGEGSHVDISQFETTVSALGPFLLDNALTGRAPERNGNRLPWLAPQGCYPCRGRDAWVAVTVAGDDQWAALALLVGGGLADDDRFTTVDGRLEHHDLLDELIATWTVRRSAAEVATRLQEHGVAAHEVHDNVGVLHDPQVRDRQWFEFVGSQRFPDGDLFGGHPIRLSATPGRWWRGGPSLGQDTVEMLTRHAGLSEEEVTGLLHRGAAYDVAGRDLTLRRPYVDYAPALGLGSPEGA
jgi:crotonobetainyl-CoA:carnitine CoA-transferase CaiB-like acyl-CoA transferase